ncbi:MAG TPA: flavin reductase family protein [Aggregatilineales bacterium]|nr:flavin reductase family protein [Aggregatilineales bacterium]
MVEFNPIDVPQRDLYKLLIGAVVPRPIAWVSTISPDGVPNLAPFSFFNGVASNPPSLVFSVSYRESTHQPKDTLANLQASGDFVVNMVTEPLATAMNITAGEYPPEVDEFQRAGLTPIPSIQVSAPRVAESPVQFECRLNQIVPIGEGPGSARLVIGTIVYIHIADAIYREPYKIDITAYQPIGRLAGSSYTRVNDLFELQRPASEIKPSGS